MRSKVIAGNWKMNKNYAESLNFVRELKLKVINVPDKVQVIICPPFPFLSGISEITKGTKIGLGAQNMHYENEGAFTGEISANMLKSVGCKYVILGHSERRTYFGETDDLVNKKVKKALENGLFPIICVGETLSEREQGVTNDIVERQIRGAYSGISPEIALNTIVAYEPVWAIGTGKNASSEQAQEVHFFIRKLFNEIETPNVASNIVILYGGSMKPDNALDLLKQNDIDGGLIGGACLKLDLFMGIINPAISQVSS